MKDLIRSRPKLKQAGFVLVTALMFLVIMAIIGIAMISNNALQERMTGLKRDNGIALQAAEAALRDGELDVNNNLNPNSAWSSTCAGGLCIPTTSGIQQWETWPAAARNYGAGTAAVALVTNPPLSAPPKYIVEDLGPIPPGAGDDLSGGPVGETYRITVQAQGANANTQVVLQSVYAKRWK